jgi:hypothetical protein
MIAKRCFEKIGPPTLKTVQNCFLNYKNLKDKTAK